MDSCTSTPNTTISSLYRYNKILHPTATPPAVVDRLSDKKYAISMGDSLGDATIATSSDFYTFDRVLRIGLLNHKIDDNLDDYRAAFDLVFVGDGGIHPAVKNLMAEEVDANGKLSSG